MHQPEPPAPVPEPDEPVKRLEERLAWLEYHVSQQDRAMLETARRLDRLAAELLRLRESFGQAPAAPVGDGHESPSVAHERPPHY